MTTRIVIVGAGIAGLAAARHLRSKRQDLELVVYEQSPEVGGRAATRRAHGAVFDHGAQYLKTPTPELHDFVTHILPHDTLVDIGLPVWTFDGDGTIQVGDPEQNADPKWTYKDGLVCLAQHLALDIDVRLSTTIGSLTRHGHSIILNDLAGAPITESDHVLLTGPAPQTIRLLSTSTLDPDRATTAMTELAHAPYRRCLSLTLGYKTPPRAQPFYAIVNTDRRHPISWLALEHTKPGRKMSGQGVLIAQMGPGWSNTHWEHDVAEIGIEVAHLVADLLKEDLQQPAWVDLQRWHDALPDGRCDEQVLNNGDGLYFAGDFIAGQGRVHLAIESGWRVAERILSDLGR